MNTEELQQQLFAEIKRKIGEGASAADEIAKLLDISSDSAYRRIRGEKTISLDELYKLCSHYKISLDQMMNLQTGSFLFQGQLVDSKNFRFDEYLMTTLHWMAYFNSFKEKEYYYLCKDMPIFHHFYFREIAAFKYFFWMKTIFHFPDFLTRKFKVNDYPDELFVLGQKILTLYNQMPSTEIWNLESINTMIRQVEYYRDSQLLESDEEAFKVYEALEKYIDHLEKQAESGFNYEFGDAQRKPISGFKMYFNEWLILDNSMMAVLDNTKLCILPHTSINYMLSRDIALGEYQHQFIKNMMRRSTLISEVSEKERSRFFKLMRDKVTHRKQSLKV
jgi:plasmid maintenance system antidote protein VapI